jgi:hypothetical protein
MVVDHRADDLDPFCLNCGWSRVIDDQCTADTVGWGVGRGMGRCSRYAAINGMCAQHANKRPAWDELFRRLLDDDDALDEAYFRLFEKACRRAGVLAWNGTADVRQLDERAAELERKPRGEPAQGVSVVYFVRRADLIKIGTTKNLRARLASLNRGDSAAPGMTITPVELLATTLGDRAFEQRLHRQFRQYRVPGTEWFEVHPELLRLIARYQRRADAPPLAA